MHPTLDGPFGRRIMEIKECIDSIDELVANGDVDTALSRCDQLIQESEKYLAIKADILHKKVQLLDWFKSDYHNCLMLLDEEISLRNQLGGGGLSGAYLLAGMINNFVGNQEVAISFLDKVILMSSVETEVAKATTILGDIYVKSDQAKASNLLEDSMEIFKNREDQYMLCHVRMSLALLHAYEGSLENAKSECLFEIEEARKLNEPGIIGTGYLRFAEIVTLENNRALARHYGIMAYEIGEANNWDIMKSEAEVYL